MIDDNQLHEDIQSGLSLDPVIALILEDLHLNSVDPKWSMDDDRLLHECYVGVLLERNEGGPRGRTWLGQKL